MGVSKAVYNGKTLIDLTQDTVTETKLLSGYTAHKADGSIINGGITTKQAATYTPGTTDQVFAEDEYLYGNVVLKGDANLLAENIREGITIFGITGTYHKRRVVYDGTTEATGDAAIVYVSSSNDAYAFFGIFSNATQNIVALDPSLIKYTPTQLSYSASSMSKSAATDLNGNMLILNGDGKHVDVYDNSLTKSLIANTPVFDRRGGPSALSIGQHALFAGGNGSNFKNITTYDTSLTMSYTLTSLKTGRNDIASAIVGNYAVFGGDTNKNASVEAFNASLTNVVASSNLSLGRGELTASAINNFIIFAGGNNGNSTIGYMYNQVDAYSADLTKINNVDNLTYKHRGPASTVIENFILIGGHINDDDNGQKMESFDGSLIHSVETDMSCRRRYPGAGTIGSFALFYGGGYSDGSIDKYIVD